MRAGRILFSLCRMEQKSHSIFIFAMALYYYLPLFKEVYQLVLKIFEYTKGFVKAKPV
jgi:hypothetical protein